MKCLECGKELGYKQVCACHEERIKANLAEIRGISEAILGPKKYA